MGWILDDGLPEEVAVLAAQPDPADEQPHQCSDQERQPDPRNHFLEGQGIADLSLDVIGLERGGIDRNGIDGQPRAGVFQCIDTAVGAGFQHVKWRQYVADAVEAREGDVAAQVEHPVFPGKGVEHELAECFHTGDRFRAGFADAGAFTRGELQVDGPLDLIADQDGVAAQAAPEGSVIILRAAE